MFSPHREANAIPAPGRGGGPLWFVSGCGDGVIAYTEPMAELSDIECLERFVAENDDLLTLEELTGKFNLFAALRIQRAEIRHSNFLAFLLDPNESHNLGSAVLRPFVMQLLRSARAAGKKPEISAVAADGDDLSATIVLREWKNIDLLVVCESLKLVVCIENKMHSSEYKEKLDKYRYCVEDKYVGYSHVFAFLYPGGPCELPEEWFGFTYAQVETILARMLRLGAVGTGSDVRLCVEHYIALLRNEIMTTDDIAALCRKIYANHRRAIDLIVENSESTGSLLSTIIDDVKTRASQWVVTRSNRRQGWLVPRCMVGTLTNDTGDRLTSAPAFVFVEFELYPDRLRARTTIGPGADEEKRKAMVHALVAPANKIGMKLGKQTSSDNVSGQWTRVHRDSLTWEDADNPPSTEKLVEFCLKYLGEAEQMCQAAKKLPGFPNLLAS